MAIAAAIEKRHHDKRGFDFWLVVPSARVDRGSFNQIRGRCVSAGGWYSRAWKGAPGGFAFKNETDARFLVSWIGSQDFAPDESEDAPTRERSAPRPAANVADRLRALADAQQKAIDAKLAPMSQNWTPKRSREHASRVHDGHNLQRAQAGLRALADAYEAGNVPDVLQGVTTKKAILGMVTTRADTSSGHYAYVETSEYHDQSAAAVALRALIDGAKSEDDRQAEREASRQAEMTRKIDELRGHKENGFFPTPAPLAARVVSAADIQPGHVVLEPSAGIGSLADAVREAEPDASLECVELLITAADVLQLKGHLVTQGDWLQLSEARQGFGPRFDRVVMNPPFNRGADAEHVLAACRCLKPGGRLVAIMTERGAERVAELAEGGSTNRRELPAESFNGSDAFNRTGVSCVLLTFNAWSEAPTEPAPVAIDRPANVWGAPVLCTLKNCLIPCCSPCLACRNRA